MVILIFKIGEFSRLTQVSIRMLRYYDETGLLKPDCIDKISGYRLYSINQISLINRIIFLRDLGFNVSEISLVMNNWENDYIVNQLINKQKQIQTTIQSEQDRLNKIQYAIDNIQFDKQETNFNVTLKYIPSYNVLSLRKIIPNYFEEKHLWEKLTNFIKNNKVKITSEVGFAMYHDQEYKECDVDVEVCAIVEKIGKNHKNFIYRQTKEVEIMACTMVYGRYENIAEAYLSFAKWLYNHTLYFITNEPNRQICHRGPWNEEDVEKYLTEIQIPIIKNNT